MELRRKLYVRGGSFETTIPRPLLFELDEGKKYDVVFRYDSLRNRWFIEIEQVQETQKTTGGGRK